MVRQLPKYPFVPAALLGREVASVAVVVDAKDDKAVSFYRRYGFVAFPDHPHRLFLPMTAVDQLFGESRTDHSR